MTPKPTASRAAADASLTELLQRQNAALAELQVDLMDRELAELSRKTYKRPLVLFFGRSTFCDNTKYLFLEAVRALPDFEVRWGAATPALAAQLRAQGLPVLDLQADLSATSRELLQCSVAVCCENPLSTFAFHPALAGALAGAQVLQLWHGVSVKHLDLMLLPFGNVLDPAFRRTVKYACRPNLFLSTASALDSFWVRAHGGAQLVRAGQPRNAVLRRPPTAQEMIGAELSPAQRAPLDAPGQRTLLVAPTWKRGAGNVTSSLAFHERLATWAAARDITVYVKPHPFMGAEQPPASRPGRLWYLDPAVDIYPWLSRFDALVTDYSSIMFDFLLTGKPIFTFEPAAGWSHRFEPDWSLVPDTPFRYRFDERSLEAVLDASFDAHPLAASQRAMAAQLFETDPLTASAELVQVIAALHEMALDRPVDVVEMDPDAACEGAAA